MVRVALLVGDEHHFPFRWEGGYVVGKGDVLVLDRVLEEVVIPIYQHGAGHLGARSVVPSRSHE